MRPIHAPGVPFARLVLILIGGLLAVSVSSILIRWCDAPAMTIATYRLTLDTVLLVLLAGPGRVKAALHLPRSLFKWGFLSGLFLAIHFTSWIRSLELTSVAISVVLVTTTPFFTAVGSWLLFRKKPAGLFWLALLVSFFGLVLIVYAEPQSGNNSLVGDGLALLGAMAMSGYILCGRYLRAHLDNFSYILLAYSSAAILLLTFIQLTPFPMTGFSGTTYLLFLLIAIFPQLLGHSSFNWALKYLSAPVVLTLLLGEPVLASIMAWIFLHETLTGFQITGSLLILTGVALAIHAETLSSPTNLEQV